MENVAIIFFVLVGLGALLAIIYILIYNNIQKNVIRIQSAEAEIDEALRCRYDILKNIENVINSNTNLAQDNFQEFAKEDLKISNFEMDRKLSKISDLFTKIKSDYPDDLETETFRNLIVDLKINEEKLVASKAYYNRFTTKLNTIIKKFPSNIIARIHKVDVRNYFDNKNMNDDDILDFKL